MTSISRRRFLLGAACAAGAVGSWAHFVEPGWVETSEYTISLRRSAPGAGTPVKVVQFSDIHAFDRVSFRHIEEAIRDGLAHNPDVICFTGDYITLRLDDPEALRRVLSIATQSVPVFAVMGNHDGGVWAGRYGGASDSSRLRQILTRAGIEVLHNASRVITVRGNSIRFVGVGDLWSGEFEPEDAFGARDELPTILLSHNPDSKGWLGEYAWDLMLCGHTHGGQIRVPVIGMTPFAPVKDHRYVAGLNPWEGRWIHTNRGIGNVRGVRFNCRPEVSVVTVYV